MPATHELHPDLALMHGQFSRDVSPALVIDPGDTVRLHTLDVTWGLENHRGLGLDRPRLRRPPGEPRYDGPAMLGPIAIRGAKPGTTLRVDILEVSPSAWGWTFAGGDGGPNAALNRALGVADAPAALVRWTIDSKSGTARSDFGLRAPLRPFPGILGLCPAAPGWHSGWEPRRTGGNMDCRELVAGSSLYLPIECEGALLSAGDGHAAQGDGEVGGSAIECRLEPLVLRLALEDAPAPAGPRIRTPGGWCFLGFGGSLDEAAHAALNAAVDALQHRLGADRTTALAHASVALSLRVTQAVNGVVGVHAVLPDEALESPSR
ncbi:MAG: acetamidase/formamidase family protein [Phycisphaerales bacterium]|nr:acetamidase/formamidase family protein [Phycisphaerales bacterium]